MLIGCPREIKNQEYRVGLTPESAKELVQHGHEAWIESGAGAGTTVTVTQAAAPVPDGTGRSRRLTPFSLSEREAKLWP